MMKRIFALLFALVILGSLPVTALAHDVPDTTRENCSIEVLVRYDGKPVSGGSLTAVKVGYVDEEDGNYFFSREYDGERLDDIQGRTAASELEEFYNENKSKYDFYSKKVSYIVDGKATFRNLPTGLYLIMQESAARGYSKMASFLVSVPYMEDGEYQYHVTASIKSELEREPDPTKPETTEDGKKPGEKLPQTGQLNWPVPVLTVVGLCLFAFGWMLRFGRKKESYEKDNW